MSDVRLLHRCLCGRSIYLSHESPAKNCTFCGKHVYLRDSHGIVYEVKKNA